MIKLPSGELLLRAKGKVQERTALERLTLRTRPDGTRIQLGEVATIIDGLAEQWVEARFDGQPAYGVEVYASRDVVDVARRVKAYVAEMSPRLPEGIQLATWWDVSLSFVERLETPSGRWPHRLCVDLWSAIDVPAHAGSVLGGDGDPHVRARDTVVDAGLGRFAQHVLPVWLSPRHGYSRR